MLNEELASVATTRFWAHYLSNLGWASQKETSKIFSELTEYDLMCSELSREA